MTITPHHPSDERIGVGILGAGPVTQAIHLPTLARLVDTFSVRRIMDVDGEVAASVAARVAASWTTSVDELLDDPAVEVVAICSPHRFHAAQVIAACRAGKKAVLCEKPFALSPAEAEDIVSVSRETGVPIIVGAMHAYDPGWESAAASSAVVPHSIRSSIVLPPNSRYEDFATEVHSRPPVVRDLSTADSRAELLEGALMGLAIHDLPLVRQLLSRVDPRLWERTEVLSAEIVHPFGYLVELRAGDVSIELHSCRSDNWAPEWRLVATSATDELRVDFTPSFVQAGAAQSMVSSGGRTVQAYPSDMNGYEGEWRHLAQLARGSAPRIPLEDAIDDLQFAMTISSRAAAIVRAEGSTR